MNEKPYIVRGRRVALREGGVEQALNAISTESAELQMDRLRFEQSFLRHFHHVGSYVCLAMGASFFVFLALDKFEFVRYALGLLVVLSTLLDAYVDRIKKRFSAREASIDERLRVLNSVVFVHGSDGPL